jgi:hypothetical protein
MVGPGDLTSKLREPSPYDNDCIVKRPTCRDVYWIQLRSHSLLDTLLFLSVIL